MSNLPIYRGVDIKTGEVFIGTSMLKDAWGNVHLIDEIRNGFNWDMCHSVFPDSLEISDGHKFRKLSECNFRTDYEMDMHSYNGYVDGWNNALRENGKPPYKVYEMIKNNK